MARFRYSAWDGTQVGFDLDADAMLAEMTDDLLYHGDLNAAMRRMMQQGFQDRDGRDVQGLREMLERHLPKPWDLQAAQAADLLDAGDAAAALPLALDEPTKALPSKD